MKNLLLVLVTLMPLFSYSQKKANEFDLKIYTAFEHYILNEYELLDPYHQSIFVERDFSFGNFSIAFPFHTKNFGHEISISAIKFKRNDYKEIEYDDNSHPSYSLESFKSENNELLLRGMYELKFKNKSKKKFLPQIGLGIEPFILYTERIPMIPTVFPIFSLSLGATVYVIPRISYALSDKVYLDFNIPFGLCQYIWNFEKHLNPAMTLEEQRKSQSDLDFLNSTFQIRFGIGVRI